MDNFNYDKIRELRNKNKMSQKDLGEHIGISDRAVSKWEAGLSYPSGQNLIKLTKIFNVPVEYFFSDGIVKAETECTGMESLTELYKIGRGPSSSHTIGPEKACLIFKNSKPEADRFKAVLYGSLAKTGKGHGTDAVIKKTFYPFGCDVEFDFVTSSVPHPNTMDLIAFKDGKQISKIRALSIGGGSITFENQEYKAPVRVYKLSKFNDISDYCKKNNITLWEYAVENENDGFMDYMSKIWNTMKTSIKQGLADSGELPGGLGVQKKAKFYLIVNT